MTKDMTSGSPAKLILRFTIPLIFGNLFQQMYSMADTIIVGKLLGTNALAAVGTTGPMNFLVLGFVMGVTSGFAVVTAQRFGAKDENGVRRSVAMNIMLCIIIGLLCMVASLGTARFILRLINTPLEIFDDAAEYIIIIYIGIPATMLYNATACILRALGDSKSPLYFLIIASVLNIVLDIVLILNFNMGVAGAAWATVISQAFAGVVSLVYMALRFPILRVRRRDFAWDMWFAWQHLKIGLPMAFQFSITAIGVIILQGALNVFGPVKIAAYTAASKIDTIAQQPFLAFLGGASSLFTEREHLFFAGEEVEKQMLFSNDAPETASVRAEWSLIERNSGKTVASGSWNGTLAPAAVKHVPFRFRMSRPGEYELRFLARSGQTVCRDSFRLTAFPPRTRPKSHKMVRLFDVHGKTEALLKRAGVPFTKDLSARTETILVGALSLNEEFLRQAARLGIDRQVREGANLVIFAQNMDSPMKAYLEERRSRITARLRQRLEDGMVDEVRQLLGEGIAADDLIYYGLEYKYVTEYVTGRITYDEMFAGLEIAIHQFAKRQMTWFRGMERRGFAINWVDALLPTDAKVDIILGWYGAEQ